jgi:prepilin-type N-terminal cleavage/methylation domain-containing protein
MTTHRSPLTTHRRRPRGFTLLELVVAMVLAAVLLLLTARVLLSATTVRTRLQDSASDISALRRAYDQISRDMHSVTVAPDDSGLQFGLTAGDTSSGTIGSSVLQLAAVVGEPILTGRQASETSLVQYAVAPDPRTGRSTLFRYETAYPVPDGSAPGTSPDTRVTALLPGVMAVQYVFYSADQQQWLDSWDGQTGLPGAIRMDVVLQQSKDRPEVARQEQWIFDIPSAKFANDEAADAAAAASTATGGTQ